MVDIKISVIIPVYNTENYLWECIESIYNQNIKEIEVIVVNDGSTDGSMDVLFKIKNKHPDLIILSQDNQKQGAARNAGLRIAKGKYVYFMDSDDYIDSEALETAYIVCERDVLDFACFQGRIVGEIAGYDAEQYTFSTKYYRINQVIYGKEFVKNTIESISLLNICFMLLKRDFLLENNMFFLEKVFYEDLEYYYRLMSTNPKFVIMDKIFYNRRYRPGSTMTSKKDLFKIYCEIFIYYKIFDLHENDLETQYRSLAIRRICNIYASNENKIIKDNNIVNILKDWVQNIDETDNVSIKSYITILKMCIKLKLTPKEHFVTIVSDKLAEIKNIVGLSNVKQIVGLYGTGKECIIILDVIGKIEAQIIFVDSFTQTGSKYFRGCPIINVKDIKNYSIDSILIMTPKYEKEIFQHIESYNFKHIDVFGLNKDFGYS